MKANRGKGKAKRQAEAEERKAARAARSDEAQMRLIKSRRGESKREVARLLKKKKEKKSG